MRNSMKMILTTVALSFAMCGCVSGMHHEEGGEKGD